MTKEVARHNLMTIPASATALWIAVARSIAAASPVQEALRAFPAQEVCPVRKVRRVIPVRKAHKALPAVFWASPISMP